MDSLKQFQNVEKLIGNTPLLEIIFTYKGDKRQHICQSGALQSDRQYQGPCRILLFYARLMNMVRSGQGCDRRGHQRQHRHLVFGDWKVFGTQGHDFYAGLDESGAD